MLVSFSPEKMPSAADFQWWLKVWIITETDSFAYSHLGARPLIFIYYSPWQHVQSVCRFPSSFNFQWAGRLPLVVLSSVGIKGKHRTGSLWVYSCNAKMQIFYPLAGNEKIFRSPEFNSLSSSSFVELFVFYCYFTPSPQVSLGGEIIEWDRVASWRADK